MDRETNGAGQHNPPAPRRTWLIDARVSHELTREQAARLVDARYKGKRKLTPEELARPINERQARRGLSQPDLAILVGCSQNEISKIETGERQRLKPQYVDAISKVLRMSRDEVMYGNPQPRIVRILGEMLGDEAIRLFKEEEHLEINGHPLPADTEGYRVGVDTLWPRFKMGDILFCRATSVPIEECIGRDCMVEIEGRLYVGEVEAGATPRLISLKRYRNPTLIDRQPARISPIEWTYHASPFGHNHGEDFESQQSSLETYSAVDRAPTQGHRRLTDAQTGRALHQKIGAAPAGRRGDSPGELGSGSGGAISRREKPVAARKLRDWRRDQGYSQTDVAKLLGCTQKMISHYETGLSEPPIDRALKLSHISKGAVPIKDWGGVRGDAASGKRCQGEEKVSGTFLPKLHAPRSRCITPRLTAPRG